MGGGIVSRREGGVYEVEEEAEGVAGGDVMGLSII